VGACFARLSNGMGILGCFNGVWRGFFGLCGFFGVFFFLRIVFEGAFFWLVEGFLWRGLFVGGGFFVGVVWGWCLFGGALGFCGFFVGGGLGFG